MGMIRSAILVTAAAVSLTLPEFASSFSSPPTILRPRFFDRVSSFSSPPLGIRKNDASTAGRPVDDYSFFDEACVYVRAGSGGQGSSTFKKAEKAQPGGRGSVSSFKKGGKAQDGIPDGGAGGWGGNVIFEVDESLNTLAGLSKRALRPNAYGGGGGAASSKRMGHGNRKEQLLRFIAGNGGDGGRMFNNGRGGEDCIVRVPPGTVVTYEVESDESIIEIVDGMEGEEAKNKTETDEIGTVTFDSPRLKVASGGKGGDGTASRRDNKNRMGPVGGERFRLKLTLKIVADVALVGVPNAGKSTFLASVTRAKPRIADYPFTTVVPNLGVWIPGVDYNDKRGQQDRAAGSTGLVLCDVPGLIAGAADGVGLGHAFLRHVERCRAILHLVDATSLDPVGDYKMVNDEINKYGKETLAVMPQVVVVNKIDAWEKEHIDKDEVDRLKKKLEKELKEVMPHTRLMWMSAMEREGVDDLMKRLSAYVMTIKKDLD